MPTSENFHLIFQQLKGILQKYEPRLVVVQDKPDNYYLNAPYLVHVRVRAKHKSAARGPLGEVL